MKFPPGALGGHFRIMHANEYSIDRARRGLQIKPKEVAKMLVVMLLAHDERWERIDGARRTLGKKARRGLSDQGAASARFNTLASFPELPSSSNSSSFSEPQRVLLHDHHQPIIPRHQHPRSMRTF